MTRHASLLGAAALLCGCTPFLLNEADPNHQLARDQHGKFMASDLGFGVDPTRPYFYGIASKLGWKFRRRSVNASIRGESAGGTGSALLSQLSH
ncbi:MAG: hypothetical protein FJZ01_00005 [Candidatus Sericytochromatia bacterium]|nr:hypothetical protein [Candidatus Tanganyikabacteria bacterium]